MNEMGLSVVRGVALALLLAGCASGPADGAPRELALGLDACGYCHMRVDDPRRAAQWVPESGPAQVFDEPGCLAAWLRERPDVPGGAWVADEEGGGWVAAEAAFYLVGVARTGMGFDAVAYARRDAAEARRATSGSGAGEIIGWEDLLARGRSVAHAH